MSVLLCLAVAPHVFENHLLRASVVDFIFCAKGCSPVGTFTHIGFLLNKCQDRVRSRFVGDKESWEGREGLQTAEHVSYLWKEQEKGEVWTGGAADGGTGLSQIGATQQDVPAARAGQEWLVAGSWAAGLWARCSPCGPPWPWGAVSSFYNVECVLLLL